MQEPFRQPRSNLDLPPAQPISTIASSDESLTSQPRADYTFPAPSLKLRSNFKHRAKPVEAIISSASPVATHQYGRCVNIPLVLVPTTLLILLTKNRIALLIVSSLLSTNSIKDLTLCRLLGLRPRCLQAPRSEAPRAPRASRELKRASTPFAPKSFASTQSFAPNSATSSWSKTNFSLSKPDALLKKITPVSNFSSTSATVRHFKPSPIA